MNPSAVKKWRKTHRKQYNANVRKYCREHPQTIAKHQRKSRLKKTYGITEVDFNDMLNIQLGLCPICLEPLLELSDICIDHDHITGRVRGLLHRKCNMLVGVIEPMLDKIDNIFKYLNIAQDR